MREVFYDFFAPSWLNRRDSEASGPEVLPLRSSFPEPRKGFQTAALKNLPEQEVIRRLRFLRDDLENRANVRGGRKIPIRWVAQMAGLDRATLYRAIWYGRISERSRAALSPVLVMLQTGT